MLHREVVECKYSSQQRYKSFSKRSGFIAFRTHSASPSEVSRSSLENQRPCATLLETNILASPA
jgi:hypothetical protein